jgi:parvulin-like peptidyl-prolyl isomerase
MFRKLVDAESEDEDSKGRGGDLTFFDRKTTAFPKAVVEGAFALAEIGDVSPPIESDQGFHVLRLTQRRPGFVRPLEEVRQEVGRLVLQEKRTRKVEELVAEMRKSVKVEIYEDRLAKVVVPPASAALPSNPSK